MDGPFNFEVALKIGGSLDGARVIATTSSAEKAKRLEQLGAGAVVNYQTTPEWHLAVRELTGGRIRHLPLAVVGPRGVAPEAGETRRRCAPTWPPPVLTFVALPNIAHQPKLRGAGPRGCALLLIPGGHNDAFH